MGMAVRGENRARGRGGQRTLLLLAGSIRSTSLVLLKIDFLRARFDAGILSVDLDARARSLFADELESSRSINRRDNRTLIRTRVVVAPLLSLRSC